MVYVIDRYRSDCDYKVVLSEGEDRQQLRFGQQTTSNNNNIRNVVQMVWNAVECHKDSYEASNWEG